MSTEFSTLEKDAKLEDIERIIENYYKESPAPKEMNDTNISLDDGSPSLVKEAPVVQALAEKQTRFKELQVALITQLVVSYLLFGQKLALNIMEKKLLSKIQMQTGIDILLVLLLIYYLP